MSVLLSALFATVSSNAWTVDGTGREAYVVWVEVDGDRIVAVGEGATSAPDAIDLCGRSHPSRPH